MRGIAKTCPRAGDREQAQAVTGWFGQPGTQPGTEQSSGAEPRHLRYFVALADAGTFTEAAEQMFIARPTLSQQTRGAGQESASCGPVEAVDCARADQDEGLEDGVVAGGRALGAGVRVHRVGAERLVARDRDGRLPLRVARVHIEHGDAVAGGVSRLADQMASSVACAPTHAYTPGVVDGAGRLGATKTRAPGCRRQPCQPRGCRDWRWCRHSVGDEISGGNRLATEPRTN
jgi:regulatory helix-turn-helix LysR family protein